ncbi:hypothetical protein [Paludisphaera rhizosphaerae]|uniref:hypothetical protein n=1 Tax=Paludisphaera rhizosphaerae TaxID=2711216 RepID=UPI0013E9B42C|nr:hypothetical protein [Paludisphaera rhizosphaerae]
MRVFRPRLRTLLGLVALAAVVMAGVSWWRRTTVVWEVMEISVVPLQPDPNDPAGDGGRRIRRMYADGRVEVLPVAE